MNSRLGWLLALLLAARSAAGAELMPLRYGEAYSALHTIYYLPIAVAQGQDFFRREGLDLQVVVPIPGGSDKMIAALHDGTVDLTHVATPFLIRAALAGSDAVAIAAEFATPIYSLVAQPEIRGFADLKGKLLGFADAGGTISYSMRKLLARHGLAAGDYRTRLIEGTSARLACLRRGECAAVPLGQPDDLEAAAGNARLLGDSTEATPAFLYTVTAARRSFAQAHAQAVTAYVRALAAAFRFIHDPGNRAAVVAAIVKTTGCSEDVADRVLALYARPGPPVLPAQGEIDMQGIAAVIGFMGESGALAAPLPAPERFADRRYLQAAGVPVR